MTHLTRADNRARIMRSGIRRSRRYGGVFAMPILPNYFVSHQWLRELRGPFSGGGRTPLIAVDFVIPDEEIVLAGHYVQGHAMLPASEAAALIMSAQDARGYEILVQRPITASEVKGTRALPQVVGWRYMPDANGREPCSCPMCLRRGSYRRRRILEKEAIAEGRGGTARPAVGVKLGPGLAYRLELLEDGSLSVFPTSRNRPPIAEFFWSLAAEPAGLPACIEAVTGVREGRTTDTVILLCDEDCLHVASAGVRYSLVPEGCAPPHELSLTGSFEMEVGQLERALRRLAAGMTQLVRLGEHFFRDSPAALSRVGRLEIDP